MEERGASAEPVNACMKCEFHFRREKNTPVADLLRCGIALRISGMMEGGQTSNLKCKCKTCLR